MPAMLVRRPMKLLAADYLIRMCAAALLAQSARPMDVEQPWLAMRLSKVSNTTDRHVCHRSRDWPCTALSCTSSLS